MDQFFLSNPEKIGYLLEAADIQPHESLLELGAGQGTVSEYFPACKDITLLELDEYLAKQLGQRFPQAKIIHADAIDCLPGLSFDVLVSNLPYNLTDLIIEILQRKKFRCAVMAIKMNHNLDIYRNAFTIDEIVVLNKHDFMPIQNYGSRLVRLMSRKDTVFS